MEDDLFGDLCPGSGPRPAQQPKAPGPASAQGSRSGDASASGLFSGSSLPQNTKSGPENGDGKASAQQLVTLSRDDFQALLSATVDSTFSKFTKTLRTVLEDMSRRIELSTKVQEELRFEIQEVKELLGNQASNYHSRFTGIDLAIKDVDRGVQSMRDKQELHEAHEMLAKFSTADDQKPQGASTGGATPASTTPAAPEPAPAPALAPAPAPAPPAPAPAPPAPAPAALVPATSAPSPSQPMMMQQAPPAMAPQQQQQQQHGVMMQAPGAPMPADPRYGPQLQGPYQVGSGR